MLNIYLVLLLVGFVLVAHVLTDTVDVFVDVDDDVDDVRLLKFILILVLMLLLELL